MTQTIGTAWLIPPRRDPNEDAAFTQLIGRMTTLDEIRPFMCPKSGGSTKKCLECQGFKTCTAGQKAVRITEEAKRPVYEQRWTNTPKPQQKPQMSTAEKAQRLNDEREEFILACESGNAWNYLMETRGLTKNAAGEVLNRMVRQFPGIAADYGGSRRIMQRPKVVKITEIAPEQPRADEEQASGATEAQTPVQAEEAANEAAVTPKKEPAAEAAPKSRRGAAANARRTEIAKALYAECMQQEDPVAFYMEKRGVSRRSALANLREMARKYGQEATEKPQEAETEIRKDEPAAAPQEPQEAPQETPQEEDADDTIDLADFLEDYAPTIAAPDFLQIARPAAKEAPRAAQETAVEADPMLATMNQRYEELKAEKERLRAEIQQAEDRIKCIEEQQDALAACLSAFRRASTGTGRS